MAGVSITVATGASPFSLCEPFVDLTSPLGVISITLNNEAFLFALCVECKDVTPFLGTSNEVVGILLTKVLDGRPVNVNEILHYNQSSDRRQHPVKS